MTVNEGQTANQTITATDPDGNALSFSKTSGPAYATVTTTTAGTGTGTGNINLAPSFTDAGTATATVRATDTGGLFNEKSLTITVNNVDRAPVVAAIANQTVAEGATADVGVSATDADDDVITLSASLPAFATLTSSPAPGSVTGTIHIAPPSGSAGTYSASVTASANGATGTRNFTITVTVTNRAPTLAQPSNMTVNEGATQDRALSATDPDGNALTFGKASGPLFLTVTTTNPGTGTAAGNAHLAPATGDRGTYAASVRVADGGGLTDQKSFNITVNAGANRPPVANPGGPYSGTVGVPVSFNGSGSTDPDGNPLTYAWDFGDGATGSGATPSHAYAAEGTFTVALTVTDNGTPPLSNTASTTATITNRVPANVFQYPVAPVKLNKAKDKSKACFQIEPVNGSYRNTDVILASIVLQYNGREAPANIDKTVINSDINLNGIQEIRACFSDAGLRFVFAGLPTGDHVVTVALEGNLTTGGRFHGETQITVRGPVAAAAGTAPVAIISPNPLNPSSKIEYVTQKPGSVKIDLFDIQGRLVRTIVDESFAPAGVHAATIDGRDQRGAKLASGVYFVRGSTADGTFKNTITILK
jgi:PKD repeat protein